MNSALLFTQAVRNIILHPARALILTLTIGITVALSLAVLQASQAATESLDSPVISEEHLTVVGKEKTFDAANLLDYLNYVPELLRVISSYELRDSSTGALVIAVKESAFKGQSALFADLPCRTAESLPSQVTVNEKKYVANTLCKFTANPPRVYISLSDVLASNNTFFSSVEIVVPTDLRDELSIALTSNTSFDSLTVIDSALGKAKLLTLTRALRFNLSIMLALTFLIAGLLIVSAYRLASLERRKDYATLLALGVSAKSLFAGIVIESVTLGAVGVLMGITIGKPLADIGARYFLESIAQQYVDASSASFALSTEQFVGAALSGILLACAGGGVIIWSIVKLPLAAALRHGQSSEQRYAPMTRLWIICAGVVLALSVLSSVILWVPQASFGAALCAILLSAVVGPLLLTLTRRSVASTSPTQLIAQADTSVAWQSFFLPLGAQSGALALCFGMGIMLSSFQTSLNNWIDETLRADLFIRDVRQSTPFAIHYLPQNMLATLAKDPIVSEIIPFSFAEIKVKTIPLSIAGTTFASGGKHRVFSLLSGKYQPEQLKLGKDALISETAARKLSIQVGDQFPIAGELFRVMGIYRDYSNEQGLILIDLNTFSRLLHVQGIVSAAIYLKEESQAPLVKDRYQKVFGNTVTLMTNGELRTSVQVIFDQTFRITTLLEYSTLALASLSFFLSLLQIAAQRASEFKTLSALGFDRRLFFDYFLRLGFRISLAALLGGAIGGLALGILLVRFVNPVSFGWTLSLSLHPSGTAYPVVALVLINLTAAATVAFFLQRKQKKGVFRNE